MLIHYTLMFRMIVRRVGRSRRCLAFFGVFVIATLAFSFLQNSFFMEYRTPQEMHVPRALYSADEYRTLLPETYTRSKPKILYWTTFFGDMNWYEESKNIFTELCRSDCTLTNKKSEIETADAVVFHLSDIGWGQGGLRTLFGHPFPSYRRPNQVWVLHNYEPVSMIWGDFTAWQGVFNWTWSYTKGSDVFTGYGERRTLTAEEKSNLSHTAQSPLNYDYFSSKNKMAGIAMISHCTDDAGRYKVIEKLKSYIDIDVYGRCGKPDPCKGGYIYCNELPASYSFYLALENSDCRDYVTEKYWRAIMRGQLPIVAWRYSMTDLVLPNSYINVYDFEDIDTAGAYIKKVSENKTLYNSYFKWKATYIGDIRHGLGFCVMCEKLKDQSVPSQVYHDMYGWLTSFTCPQFTVSSSTLLPPVHLGKSATVRESNHGSSVYQKASFC